MTDERAAPSVQTPAGLVHAWTSPIWYLPWKVKTSRNLLPSRPRPTSMRSTFCHLTLALLLCGGCSQSDVTGMNPDGGVPNPDGAGAPDGGMQGQLQQA